MHIGHRILGRICSLGRHLSPQNFNAMKLKAIATLIAWIGLWNAPFASKNIATDPAGSNPTKNIPVTVTDFETGKTSQSMLSIQSFDAFNTGLIAVGTLDGKTIQAPVAIFESTCEKLNLNVGPIRLELGNAIVDMSKVDVDLTPNAGNSNGFGDLLCDASTLINAQAPAESIAKKCNDILLNLE